MLFCDFVIGKLFKNQEGGKTIRISNEAYEWILRKSSEYTIKRKENVSMADIVDEIIEVYNHTLKIDIPKIKIKK